MECPQSSQQSHVQLWRSGIARRTTMLYNIAVAYIRAKTLKMGYLIAVNLYHI